MIEDNPDHQLLIGYSLRASIPQIEPVFAATADEALEYLNKCLMGYSPFPELVLLDVNLPQPEMGWQLLKQLRTGHPCLPVLVLSGNHEPHFVQRAYELGAHSFLAKPHNLEGWEMQFQILRIYWLGIVTLPSR